MHGKVHSQKRKCRKYFASCCQSALRIIPANFTLPFAILGSAAGMKGGDFNPTVLRNCTEEGAPGGKGGSFLPELFLYYLYCS